MQALTDAPPITDWPTRRRSLIGGEETDAVSGERFSRTSPAHDTVVSTYPKAADDDVNRAAEAA